ncbi:MAG: hypothetical protein GX638_07430 [Crenarchaeota archaeon]|nr:hypothetical protein [Thermoproteota archaeon]
MEEYLEEKYGKEFVVKGVGYRCSYYGDGLYIAGIAHPKDDSNLQFKIARDSSGGVFGEYQTYGEFPAYISNVWAKQTRKKVKAVLKNDLVWTGINLTNKKEELYGRTVSIDEAEKLFEDRMELYISYVVFVSPEEYRNKFTDFNNLVNGELSQDQANELYGTISKLKNDKYKKITVIIRCFNKCYQKEVTNEIMGYFKRGIYEFNVYEDNLLYRIRIHDINHINQPDDIGFHIDAKDAYSYLYKIK